MCGVVAIRVCVCECVVLCVCVCGWLSLWIRVTMREGESHTRSTKLSVSVEMALGAPAQTAGVAHTTAAGAASARGAREEVGVTRRPPSCDPHMEVKDCASWRVG